MNNASPSQRRSTIRRNRKIQNVIEGLESRSYLSGVVFGNPVNTSTAFAGINPVYVNLDDIYNTQVSGKTVADLITANVANGSGVQNSVSILPGDPSGIQPGTFGTANTTNTIQLNFSPLTIRTGALGTGSNEDIVVGSTNGSTNSNSFEVIINNGDGTFTPHEYTVPNMSDTQSIAIGNFGNGHLDVAVASYDSGTSNNVAIYMNDGTGALTLEQVLSVPHANIASITAFNAGNGLTDLAVADSVDNAVTILGNNGSGTFTDVQDYPVPVGSDPVTITDGEFNQNVNTNDDLVTANATGDSVSVLLGNGNGTFGATKTTTVTAAAPEGGPLKVRVATLTAGGLPDIFCLLSEGSSGDAEVLLGNGDGTFHVGNLINTGGATRTGIAAGDLNGDGLTDMVLVDSGQITSLINTTSQDTTPPTASLVTTQPTMNPGDATIQFSVTYTDAQQVDTSTLNGSNLTVTGPNGNTETVSLVSTNLAPAASVTVTYSIPALSGAASTADNGTYTVSATSTSANAVMNANGLPVAGAQLGQFTVSVPVVTPNGPDLVASVTARNPATAVAGTRFAGATRVTVLNSGNALAKGKIAINLYSSPSETTSGATLLETVTRNINLKAGKSTPIVLPGFKWPAGVAGNFFLVADVNATHTISESSYADNLGISATATAVALPFVDIENLWSGKLPATLKVGRRAALAVALKNIGNTAARATANFTIQALDTLGNATTVGSGTVRIAAAAKGRQTVSLPLTLPSTLTSGTYQLLITVSYPGDTNAGNDSVTSTGTFTV